jgi:hypothetical protein
MMDATPTPKSTDRQTSLRNSDFWHTLFSRQKNMASRAMLLVLAASFAGGSLVPLELLHNPKARCMDGTPGGFYHQRNLDPEKANNWVIHLQGKPTSASILRLHHFRACFFARAKHPCIVCHAHSSRALVVAKESLRSQTQQAEESVSRPNNAQGGSIPWVLEPPLASHASFPSRMKTCSCFFEFF